jgi:CRISPR-associated protein Cas8a1/Csx13
MSKAATKQESSEKTESSSVLELALFSPGMDSMLRAGLGGLAAVLWHVESQIDSIRDKKRLPGWPWKDGAPPWRIEPEKLVIEFGKPELAGEFLKRLFEYAFRVNANEQAIDLPATYVSEKQDRLVRATLQRGLMLTFLQHGQSRKTAKDDDMRVQQIDGKDVPYSIRPVYSYKHQSGYMDLVDSKKGTVHHKSLELPGTLYPGAAVRHNKFSSHTKHEASVGELLCAYFALIGTLALPVNRGSAVLLVPHVIDLIHFARNRRSITPEDPRDCIIGGVGDAVLGVYVRQYQRDVAFHLKVPAISAYLFQPTAWASQQKSRVAAISVRALEPSEARIFASATRCLGPQLRTRTIQEKTKGKGRNKTTVALEESFWSHSIVKPLIADNLANGRPWFVDFVRLFTRKDLATGKPLRTRLFFEKEGLAQMVRANVWSDEGQRALVTGVQFALSCQFGKISGEFSDNPQGMKNKFQREFEKWRIQFASAKTADQFRFSVCDLMSRARGNDTIQQNWQKVLPLISDDGWQLGRDLALLALAAYQGKGDKEALEGEASQLIENET